MVYTVLSKESKLNFSTTVYGNSVSTGKKVKPFDAKVLKIIALID